MSAVLRRLLICGLILTPGVALTVPAAAEQEEVQALAMADENVQRHTEGKTVRKVIYIKKKILNIVVG